MIIKHHLCDISFQKTKSKKIQQSPWPFLFSSNGSATAHAHSPHTHFSYLFLFQGMQIVDGAVLFPYHTNHGGDYLSPRTPTPNPTTVRWWWWWWSIDCWWCIWIWQSLDQIIISGRYFLKMRRRILLLLLMTVMMISDLFSLFGFSDCLIKYKTLTMMMISVLFSLLGFSDYPTTGLMEQPVWWSHIRLNRCTQMMRTLLSMMMTHP